MHQKCDGSVTIRHALPADMPAIAELTAQLVYDVSAAQVADRLSPDLSSMVSIGRRASDVP